MIGFLYCFLLHILYLYVLYETFSLSCLRQNYFYPDQNSYIMKVGGSLQSVPQIIIVGRWRYGFYEDNCLTTK